MSEKERYFKLTRDAIRSYKKADPLKGARDPRPRYFAGHFDMAMAQGEWFIWVVLILFCALIDIVMVPFFALTRTLQHFKEGE